MSNKDLWTLAAVVGGVAVVAYLNQSGLFQSASAQATPLSVYPELAYTAVPATTSMAATNAQQASAAVLPQTPLYSSVQLSEANAIYGQCVGANVCTPLSGDTQLGL